jgi:hypothetical protein
MRRSFVPPAKLLREFSGAGPALASGTWAHSERPRFCGAGTQTVVILPGGGGCDPEGMFPVVAAS